MANLFLFYKSPGSNELFSCQFDGNQWSGNTRIEVTPHVVNQFDHFLESSCGPAISFSNNADITDGPIVLVYKAANSTALNMASFGAGKWLSDVPIQSRDGSIRPPTSDQTPAVTAFRNFLFLVFKAAGTNDLNVAQMDGLGNWHWNINIATLSGGAISPKTTLGPSIITFNNTLFIIYRSENSNDLRVATFDGKLWSDATIASQHGSIAPESTCAPALALFNNQLFMVYRSPNNYDLNYATFDGNIWLGNSEIWKQPGPIHPESSCSPGLAVFNNRLFLSYKSPQNNDLNIASFDGTNWFGNTQIYNQPGGIRPESDSSPAAIVG
jgi:hypothetical protein